LGILSPLLNPFVTLEISFLLVTSGNGVMTKIDDAAKKPGAFCVCAHTVVLLGTRWYHG
jgi:hypothetical protein